MKVINKLALVPSEFECGDLRSFGKATPPTALEGPVKVDAGRFGARQASAGRVGAGPARTVLALADIVSQVLVTELTANCGVSPG